MKIVITGFSGFVGSNLERYLDDNYILKALSARYIPNQKFNLDAHAVIHLAGKAHDLKKAAIPSEYYEANNELTKQLFDSFLASKATIFIFMSTVKAVADNLVGELTEDISPNPKTHYGISKHLAEEYILAQELPKDKRVFILRPCMIHGPNNKGNLNLLFQLVSKGIPWPLGVFNNKRSFLSVENLCFVIKELLQNQTIRSGVYNVSDDDYLSTNELIGLIGESLDKKNRIVNLPKLLVIYLARMGDRLHLPFNSERLGKLTENFVVSNKKITKEMGVKLPVTAKEGLIRTFNSFKD